ncbi:MAG TPA: TIGR00730 family Rossman fold protein [Gemmatimonadota bacterium]|nr:TIGR00730 family Rossman fold protein [Gemmatimonadota bacterium]
MPNNVIKQVCVYCASSTQADESYLVAAERLGQVLAANSIAIAYGGGGVGSMGRLADGALSAGGKVVGVIPRFMKELEWYHREVSEFVEVDDLHDRKRRLLNGADAVVALPGGSGTLDELLEAISLKRLGSFTGPIVMVNTRRFFDPCLEMLERCIEQRFMQPRHRDMWQVVDEPEQVIEAFASAPPWSSDAIGFAAL